MLCNIHTFLLQKDAIAKLVTAMKEAYAAEPSTLFVIGSYHIGKERAFFSAAQALGFRIWCDPGKKKVRSCCFPSKGSDAACCDLYRWGSLPAFS